MAKQHGIKNENYWEHFGNLMGTHSEQILKIFPFLYPQP
jgi:hypothetical protein